MTTRSDFSTDANEGVQRAAFSLTPLQSFEAYQIQVLEWANHCIVKRTICFVFLSINELESWTKILAVCFDRMAWSVKLVLTLCNQQLEVST